MTAVGAALLVAAFAGWLWQQVGLISLPNKAYTITVAQVVTGDLAKPGSELGLYTNMLNKEGKSEVVGSSKVISVETRTASSIMTVEPPVMKAGRVPQDTNQIGVPEGGAAQDTFSASANIVNITGISGVPVVNPIYVQATASILVLLLGSVVVYWIVGLRPSTVDFLVSTDGEMKKVNWSTRREIMGSTWVVIGATFLISLLIFVFDIGLQAFFSAIGVLQKN